MTLVLYAAAKVQLPSAINASKAFMHRDVELSGVDMNLPSILNKSKDFDVAILLPIPVSILVYQRLSEIISWILVESFSFILFR